MKCWYYEDLPTSWMKVWDAYNVVNAFTKDGKEYPAWTNVAWNGTEWDPFMMKYWWLSEALSWMRLE